MAKIKGDLDYLVRQGGYPTWHCQKDVPEKLRHAVGKARLIKSLGTHDVRLARSLRWKVLADFEAILVAARSKVGPETNVQAGLAWRDTFARVAARDPTTIRALTAQGDTWGPDDQEHPRPLQRIAQDNAEMSLDILANELGETDRALLLEVAYGHATPLLHYVEAWLAEGGTKGPLRPRTASQYRNDVQRLASWAKGTGLPPTFGAFTKAVVGRYITETMIRPKVDPGTGNRWISAASSYWRWMMKRAGLASSPWTGQSMAKAPASRAGGERPKRSFTDAEVRALLDGLPGQELADLIRIGALSGMRLEEIYRLTTGDCVGGWFNVRLSKTNCYSYGSESDRGVAVLCRFRGAVSGSLWVWHAPAPCRSH